LAQALTILRNDKGEKAANLLTEYAFTLLQNSDLPDAYEDEETLDSFSDWQIAVKASMVCPREITTACLCNL